ncbi:hypothetical protein H2200_008994 [Cladophialophora chaetospira]|uniref:Fungal N-terminal domain-containing protein n=1 Tax=Cladophialophora chaetospira TaxID=386627 RepID=A0AA39CFS6_9EURO|nr:hypothetical protein H2200_008994 [Cladophialophora chaetospira]
MAVTTISAAGIASAVLGLSKAAWKLGTFLSKLEHGFRSSDTTVKSLIEESRSLSNECDLFHAELDEIISRNEIGSFPSQEITRRIWSCVATEVDETSRTLQELEDFVEGFRDEDSDFIGHVQRQEMLDKSKNQIANGCTKVRSHAGAFHNTLSLIHVVFARIATRRDNREIATELEKLRDMVERLQRSLEDSPQSRMSHTEAFLLQCGRQVIAEGKVVYDTNLDAGSISGGQRAASSNIRVAEWVSTLESIRRDEQLSDTSDMVSNVSSIFSRNETYTVLTSAGSEHRTAQQGEVVNPAEDDSDDDLDIDLAKAALETGSKAFEAQEWEDADAMLQEALRVLPQLSKHKRSFCDIHDLQYRLAVCAYHTQQPADAEEALLSLMRQSAKSDEQRRYICNAAHLLSLLYIRTGQTERARSECEKALQARRRLLGKLSDASLESMALMAHIYVLLNNRARAKSYLAMIPESRREATLRIVEESLGTKPEQLDSSSQLGRSISDESDLAEKHPRSVTTISSPVLPPENRRDGPVSATKSQAPIATLGQPQQPVPTNKVGLEHLKSVTVTSLLSMDERRDSMATEMERTNDIYSSGPEAVGLSALSLGGDTERCPTLKNTTLSRKEILKKIGCQPRDQIEEAVCNGDNIALASLLSKKKESWRSKFRKRLHAERVTALHFAALFGEIDMARRLLGSGFNINEVPHGYSENLTPLKFAIGARQVDMVDFLITNGARPSEPDTWSTLAGILMNRSWLMKTMSEAENEFASIRIIAILRILLKRGWEVDSPVDTSGRSVLHQAVGLWTGSYKLDLQLRVAVASFLCEQGANPFQANAEDKTPYDMASTSGHQELMEILEHGSKSRTRGHRPMEPVELPTEHAR